MEPRIVASPRTPFPGRLRLPAIAAPMFLASGPDLVVESCKSGVIGCFPALNQRSTEGFDAWVEQIAERLARHEAETGSQGAPFGVNLSVKKSNARLQADIEVVVKRRVPLVLTSLGAAREVVAAVHSYGGVVYHDVVNVRHAEKAIEAGVDGIIAVCAGAGGHAGVLSPFALVSEIRAIFDGVLVLGGAITNGRQIAAALTMGADLASLGTRFIATNESLVPAGYKQMLCAATAKDIVYTQAISGVPASFMRQSLAAAGLDPDALDSDPRTPQERKALAWKTIWSAGQGVGAISDIPTVAELCTRLIAEYRDAIAAAAHFIR
jgi:nitronate monooxygenase